MDFFGVIMFTFAVILIGLLSAATLFIICTPIYFFFEMIKRFEGQDNDKESR